jgi:hypothetical protein
MGHFIRLLLLGCIIACLLVFSVGATTPEVRAQWKIAQNFYVENKCPSALVASEKAIAMDPLFAPPWNVKGCALHCLGRNQEALADFEKAFELDPTFDMAKKNADRTRNELKNGAPLNTPPVILPADRNESLQYDGELKYDPIGEPTGSWAFVKDGHAVFYSNNKTIDVTGIRVAGCRYGKTNAKVVIEIWDKNLSTLYHDEIPYDSLPFRTIQDDDESLTGSSWVDIALPDHEVTGDFYIVIFTDSYPLHIREHGIYIAYYTPSETGTSATMLTYPNRFDTPSIGKENYTPDELDWMIHVLYKNPPASAAIVPSTPGPGADHGAMATVPSQVVGTEPVGPGPESRNTAPSPTKAPLEGGLLITGVISGILCIRIRH